MMISPTRTRSDPLKFGQWLGLLALVASLVLLWSLRQSLIYLFAAVVLAMALCTLVGSIRSRLGCSRPLALLLSLGTVLLVLTVAAAGSLEGWSIADLTNDLWQQGWRPRLAARGAGW